jgi:hypothetical protein
MKEEQVQAKPPMVKRVAVGLGIAFALFLSIFALDVFQEGQSISETLTALGIHLLPTLALLLFVWIGSKNAMIGGLLFILVGIAYIFEAGGQALLTYLLIAGIPILIGVLFLWGNRLEKQV